MLYNNLPSIKATTFRYPTSDEARAELALDLDNTVRENAQANWKGDEQKEKRVQNALYPKLDKDPDATMAIFEIAKNQSGY